MSKINSEEIQKERYSLIGCNMRNTTFLYSILVFLLFLGLSGCGLTGSINKAVEAIDKSRQTIQQQSDAWRSELPNLLNELRMIESEATGDAKVVIADARNQVESLYKDSLDVTKADTHEEIFKTGVEFRCNVNFVQTTISTQLQHLTDDLKFWKKRKQHQNPNPVVCQVNPDTIRLYPAGNTWYIDSGNMTENNIVKIFGYDFPHDATPTLNLLDVTNKEIRSDIVTPMYQTQYQLNIDLSTVDFSGVADGSYIVFDWPDWKGPTKIPLTLNKPAKLKITSLTVEPETPVANIDKVTFKITFENTGGMPITSAVFWLDPGVLPKTSVTYSKKLQPHQSDEIIFPEGYVYTIGKIYNINVYVSDGSSTLSTQLEVKSDIWGISICEIREPFVDQRWTDYPVIKPHGFIIYAYPDCLLLPGDKVEIVEAGGCVNTGGVGRTTKRYVDPIDSDGNIDNKYYGLIAIPGTLGEETSTSIYTFTKEIKVIFVAPTPEGAPPPVIELGYVDDAYGDNGYENFDDGIGDQCRNTGPAFVIIKITHYIPH